MEMMFHMLKATGGKRDAAKMMKAIEGYSWDSPRGPVQVDPKTRELIQNVYIMRVKKVDGKLIDAVFETYKAQNDPWHDLHPAGKTN
jgi:branched-chain amino acid transport system substrate-binding protein